MQTIGILLPRSSYYETMGFDMYEGLRSGLRAAGINDVRVVTENIGFGAEKQHCYRSTEKLLLEENASVIFAYVGQRTAQLLKPLFLASNRLLIVLDSGANMPNEWPVSPNILYHSLHNSAGAYSASALAVRDGYRQGGMVSCYYDGGYLHTYAAMQGFTSNGGQIQFNHATGYTEQDFKMDPLPAFLQSYPGSCQLSLFSGDFCQWYFRDLAKLFEGNCPPVYMPPFAFEEIMLAKSVYPGDNVRGVASWSKEFDNAENRKFLAAMDEAGRNASLFSLLGWEAASLVPIALEAIKENRNNVAATNEKIKSASFVSPRGQIRFHQESNHSYGPLFEAKIEADGNGFCRVKTTGEISNVAETLDKLNATSLENAISGWYNSYTCN